MDAFGTGSLVTITFRFIDDLFEIIAAIYGGDTLALSRLLLPELMLLRECALPELK